MGSGEVFHQTSRFVDFVDVLGGYGYFGDSLRDGSWPPERQPPADLRTVPCHARAAALCRPADRRCRVGSTACLCSAITRLASEGDPLWFECSHARARSLRIFAPFAPIAPSRRVITSRPNRLSFYGTARFVSISSSPCSPDTRHGGHPGRVFARAAEPIGCASFASPEPARMTASILLAVVWFLAVCFALSACAVFERRARVFIHPRRKELNPPRQFWGGDILRPPAASVLARALADFSRLVRSDTVVPERRVGLALLGRAGIGLTLATGLAMIPFAGTWGGGLGDEALVPLDLEHGLAALGLLFVLTALSRVTLALSEPSPWSRLGGARQASRSIAALALLTLVLMPIAVASGSLRLHEIVLDQQRPLVAIHWLLSQVDSPFLTQLQGWSWPAWNLFTQPITALLFIPTLSLLLASSRIDEPATGSIGVAGLGLDADPVDLYWIKLDTRLSSVLGAALFVTLFLGAGSIPFFDSSVLVPLLVPYVGEAVPTFLVTLLHFGTFLVKWLLVLAIAARMKRITASARDDRSLRLATRRLLPLAWANLLLVTSVTLWLDGFVGGSG